ncbi:MAG: diphthine--ammonia ligase [Dehalococcoidia bacterium]|nr:diphthine--ammonia ligase [Dehalococcoidia bacterium]
MTKAFVSWSGGKDCALAAYRALKNGTELCYLLNMAVEDGAKSHSHGLSAEVLQKQARAVGVPLVQRRAAWEDYEAEFKHALRELREQNVTDGIFGDINIDEHRQWVERVCWDCGIIPQLPLWQNSQKNLLQEFIQSGFKAVIVSAKAGPMDEKWLGRSVDAALTEDLSKYDITPCGEAGEYHTVVTDGPLFKLKLKVMAADKIMRGGHWYFDIKKCDLLQK